MAFLKPDLAWINEGNMGRELKATLNDIYLNRHQGKHFYIQMAQHIGNPECLNENQYPNMPYPDDGYRLLSLFRYWNMINYFFPYKHLIDEDWDKELREYIPIFINASDELEYELAAIQIIGDIKDTHANLWEGNDKINEKRGDFYPPFHVRFVEEKLVVTDYYNPELKNIAGLAIGDIITHINENPVDRLTDSLSQYYPASNIPTRKRDISADLLRSKNNRIKIGYISEGQNYHKDIALYPRDSLKIYRGYRRDNEKSFKLLEGNIGYVTLSSIKEEDIAQIIESFKKTEGIIIDIRNYPSAFVPFSLGSYFVSSPTPFVKFTMGNVDHPGEFTFTGNQEIPDSSPSYKGKLVVMLNEISQSQAEYTAMAFNPHCSFSGLNEKFRFNFRLIR